MNITIYRCFSADQRLSMDVYADGLIKAVNSFSGNVNEFIPSSYLERYKNNAFIMRYLRYQTYADQVKKNINDDNQIHHVIDHGYAHLYPSFSGQKSCISVHDLIPYLTWKGVIKPDVQGGFFDFRKPSLNLYSLKFIKKFDRIITVSQNTANDLQTYLNIDSEKISVIPPVINEAFKVVDDSRKNKLREKYRLKKNTKLLMVSGAEYYKNHRTSLLVLKSLLKNTDHSITLIKTGRESVEFNELVDELGLYGNVRQLFLKDEAELATLYNVVDCLLFPSLYEGFGMPVAEALSCGTPVVISNKASLPEVGGTYAIQHDCFDVDGISTSIDQLLTDKAMTQRVYEQAPIWCEQFRAPSISRRLNQAYNQI